MADAEHDAGVEAAKRWLRGEGYTIQDIPDIGGSRPDAYGEKELPQDNISKVLVEVETCDSLEVAQSATQMGAFSTWASEYSTRRAVLFVPERCLNEARKNLPKYSAYHGF